MTLRATLLGSLPLSPVCKAPLWAARHSFQVPTRMPLGRVMTAGRRALETLPFDRRPERGRSHKPPRRKRRRRSKESRVSLTRPTPACADEKRAKKEQAEEEQVGKEASRQSSEIDEESENRTGSVGV